MVEVARWKAVEFRQFLLNTGIVALSGHLPIAMNSNFMLLGVAMHILLRRDKSNTYNSYAKCLLQLFVQNFSQLYGENMLVYNVHGLLHLADDAKLHVSLDNVSAFPLENFMRNILNSMRKPSLHLQQVIRRWHKESFRQIKSSIINKPLHIRNITQVWCDMELLLNISSEKCVLCTFALRKIPDNLCPLEME